MQSFTSDALVPYGFSDRVRAQYRSDDLARGRDPDAHPARVTRVERSECFAVDADGLERRLRAEPLPAVGDWILAGADSVHRVLERSSALTRADPSGNGVQVLAANVDLVLITAPADRASAARVERELAIAWDSGALPLVLVTKADLDVDGVARALAARLLGVEVVTVSVESGEGIAELRARLRPDLTAVLLGPSGAGKSTLVNALLEADRLATGAVREGDRRGRHTTTTRQLVAVPGGGVLIDSPGLRSLGLGGEVSLSAGFPDVEALAARCRFSDCHHEQEPGCAVTAAIAAGELDPDRLGSFRKLAGEVAAERRRRDPVARREERQLWRARAKAGRAAGKRERPS